MDEDETPDGTETDTDTDTETDTDTDTETDESPDALAAALAQIEELAASIAARDINIATLTGQLAGAQQANRDLLALIGAPADDTSDDSSEEDYDTVPETAVDSLYND